MSAEYTVEQIVDEIFRRWDVLHKRIADLELENERLKQHVKDLDKDMDEKFGEIPCSKCGKPTTWDTTYGDLCHRCCRADNE